MIAMILLLAHGASHAADCAELGSMLALKLPAEIVDETLRTEAELLPSEVEDCMAQQPDEVQTLYGEPLSPEARRRRSVRRVDEEARRATSASGVRGRRLAGQVIESIDVHLGWWVDDAEALCARRAEMLALEPRKPDPAPPVCGRG